MQAPCYTIDFANNSHSFACSGVEGVVYLFTIDLWWFILIKYIYYFQVKIKY